MWEKFNWEILNSGGKFLFMGIFKIYEGAFFKLRIIFFCWGQNLLIFGRSLKNYGHFLDRAVNFKVGMHLLNIWG